MPVHPAPTRRTRPRARWAQPLVVVEVNYREIAREGRLRAPSWRGIRIDIEPTTVAFPVV